MAAMSCSAWPRQKRSFGASSVPARARTCAAASAPARSDAARSGLQLADGVPLTPRGSNTLISPRCLRSFRVARSRSVLTDETMVGPAQAPTPSIRPVVFPDCDGPNTATAPRTPRRPRSDVPSVERSRRSQRASTNRPGSGRRVSRGRRSRVVARRAWVSTPSRRRLSGGSWGCEPSRRIRAVAITTASARTRTTASQ